MDLPLPAQAVLHQTLGRDQTAYHAAPEAGGYRFTNTTHGLTGRFDPHQAAVTLASIPWDLKLQALGRGGNAAPLPGPVTPAADANRLSYRYPGLEEWYVNGPLGIEQGMTLTERPQGDGELTLALARPPGTLALAADGLALTIDTGAAKLRYAGLHAFDAEGRELPARLTLTEHTLSLRVDDTGAVYPVTVDPFVQQAKLTASDKAADDQLGTSVAIAGDTIVAGAPFADPGGTSDAGAAYVFVKTGPTWSTMTQTAKLTASDKAAGDQLGFSIAIDGDTIVAGAPFANAGGASNAGAAYVFVKPVGGWADMTQNAILTNSNKVADDNLGTSVAIAGDTVAVGSPGANPFGANNAGIVYVFVKPGGGWADMNQTAPLIVDEPSINQSFVELGTSVAISGDTVVAGARFADPGGTIDAGAAYVFVKPSGGWAGLLTQTAKLTASDKSSGNRFGTSVAITGDTIVAGAPLADPDSITQAGAAYVFVKPGLTWADMTQTAKLTASDKAAADHLGTSVAIAGDTVVAGARFADPGGINAAGAVYVFVKPVGGWADMTQTAKLTAIDKAMADRLGTSVAIAGDAIVAGAPFADNAPNAGAAYVFGFISPVVFLTPSLDFGNQVVGTTSAVRTATVTNTGAGPVSIVGISVSGAHAGDFSAPVGGSTCVAGVTVLGASQSCFVAATFTPSATGDRFGLLTVSTSAGDLHAALSGTGVVTGPALSFNTASLGFGNQPVGVTSAVMSATLTNVGGAPVSFTAIALTGVNAADYALDGSTTCGAPLAPGASCVVAATFTPLATGGRLAGIQVVSNAPGSPHTVTLTGTGLAGGLQVSSLNLNFGNQLIGGTSAPLGTTLTNTGSASLTVNTITLGGTDAASFANELALGSCGPLPLALAPGASCVVAATFTPLAPPGAKVATFAIGSTGGSATVTLLGNALPPAALLHVSDANLDFGTQTVGTTGAPQVTTLTNLGGATLTYGAFGVGGTHAGDFAILGAPGTTCNPAGGALPSGVSCDIAVAFTPTATGNRFAAIAVSSNGGNATVSLAGLGTNAPVGASPALDFGRVIEGEASSPLSLVVTNAGAPGSTLTLGSPYFTLGGPEGAQFSVTPASTCANNMALASGATCTVVVTFHPAVTGATSLRTGLLTVSTNGGSLTAGLSGTGVARVPVVKLSSLARNFGNQTVGTASPAQVIELVNIGGAPLTISSITPLLGPHAADFAIDLGLSTCDDGAPIAPTGTCLILVSFTPSATGTRVAQIEIISNAPPSASDPNIQGSPHFVALAGNGISDAGGGALPVPLVDLFFQGLGGGLLTNPVNLKYTLVGCFEKETFLVVNAPSMGIPWSYLNSAGQFVPLPSNLAQITPWLASGPIDGTYTLFSGNAPPGTYEVYLGCDNVKDGRLNIDLSLHVNGIYDYVSATVK